MNGVEYSEESIEIVNDIIDMDEFLLSTKNCHFDDQLPLSRNVQMEGFEYFLIKGKEKTLKLLLTSQKIIICLNKIKR